MSGPRILMGSCRHEVVLGATDLEKEESYRAVHFLYEKLSRCDFLCQDVICHYWKFAMNVGKKIPEYDNMTRDIEPFLSNWHGKTHTWYCQVLWSGHWKTGAAGTLGEEQEQTFAYFTSLALIAKRIDTGSRRDAISTSAMYYDEGNNREKDCVLVKRLARAVKQFNHFKRQLDEELACREITIANLPEILLKLKEKALGNQQKCIDSNSPLHYERQDVEGFFMCLQRYKKG